MSHERQVSDKTQKFEYQLGEAKAMLKDVEYQMTKLKTTLEVMRDVHRVLEQDLEELRQAMRSSRRNRSRAPSGPATQGPQNPLRPEKASSPKKIEAQRSPSVETMEHPSTPPPRPNLSPTTTAPKRKAPESSELRSMNEHRDTTPSRVDPFRNLFDSPRRRAPLRHTDLWDEGDLETRLFFRHHKAMPWPRDERDRHFMTPSYTQKTQDNYSWDKLFLQSHGVSSDSPKKPSGTDPPERTQEGNASVLPRLDDYDGGYLKDMMESMDKDEPSRLSD
ncbi:hypothetical protein FHL15_003360 [Xylaria flabelliformis]|uniref:Uncharacterized protein n=1 Tax=Xylaria flabelliformis TaxID=2512241 RepID=A0A553I6G9_9PEZI|nr:hypothetical protein FHL15_003360 [Xylaria flabelliformis]